MREKSKKVMKEFLSETKSGQNSSFQVFEKLDQTLVDLLKRMKLLKLILLMMIQKIQSVVKEVVVDFVVKEVAADFQKHTILIGSYFLYEGSSFEVLEVIVH
jgi:hypothetical protein